MAKLQLPAQSPCPYCGGTAELVTTTLERRFGRVRLVVEDVPAYRCAACGEETLELQTAAALDDALAPVVRALAAMQ